ncbi:MAG: metallothionein [Granulosicoccus sp.]|nr:metallothionein [Granulosicoccus sp.]
MTNHVCAHEPCTCQLGDSEGIKGEDGMRYCSPGCKEGQGCDCPGCGCRMDTLSGNEVSEIPMI